MNKVKAIFKNAWPYQKDKMNLPVQNLDTALPFYENIMGFQLISRNNSPHESAILERDGIRTFMIKNKIGTDMETGLINLKAVIEKQ